MRPRIVTWIACGLFAAGFAGICAAQTPARAPAATVLEASGTVQFLPDKTANWYPCTTNQPLYAGDQVRTGPRSRAAVRLSDLTVFRMGPQGYLRIRPEQRKRSAMDILRGVFYFLHRDDPGEFDLQTPIVSAVVRGTEFNVEVADDGTTTLTVIEGEVQMANNLGELQLKSGEQGRAEPGKAPVRTAVIEAQSVIQWSLYYPGVLDADELSLSAAQKEALSDSLAAYRSGDLLAALAKYPADRTPEMPSEQVYFKALELAAGRTTNAAALKSMAGADAQTSALDGALNRVVAIVQGAPGTKRSDNVKGSAARRPELATEWMAESIYEQSRHNLGAALDAARKAVEKSPSFGFAWERVAELEFGFGRVGAAKRALDRSLELSPRNAQALALKGFLLAAENRTAEAITWFDRAIAVDGGLGNAWLGRGLTRIRKGDAEGGRQDIQVAATVEPQRAAFRSYLGKAFSHTGDNRRATNELALAMELDPNDPTAWLYSALIKQQENRINEAVRDFERAQELADNRGVYRSRLLLDQDRAVSGVNLATIYQDAGMAEVSVREAARAVSADYSVYSSHLFLANSYNALRDVRQVNLRYETPAVSEYLVANLLAPVGAGILSPHVTQQEYSKLFERDRVGVSSTTEYLSRGDWYQALSQYGTFGNASYAVDGEYRFQNGDRPNNELEQMVGSIKFKQELTPNDSVFVQGILTRTESGDLRQLYDPNNADRSLEITETQRPIFLLGYHHEWSPASQTLFLGGYLQDTLKVSNPNQPVLIFGRDASGQVIAVPEGFVYPTATNLPSADFDYRSDFHAYTAELQHIWKTESRTLPGTEFHPFDHTLVFGARFQAGTFDTSSEFGDSTPTRLGSTTFLTDPSIQWVAFASSPSAEEEFQRATAYIYDNWQLFNWLMLSAGVTYDYLRYPQNFRNPPVSSGQEETDQFSPKAGLVWTPLRDLTVRAAYTRSLAGASFDQSFQLEPSQIAGFNQSFRSLIPESLEGAIAGAEFETWGVSVDQKFGSGTYLGAQAEWLNSDARRQIGITEFTLPNTQILPGTTPQELRYEERTLLFTFNQLIGKHLALGLRYRMSDAELETHLTEVTPAITPEAHTDERAILHQLYGTVLAHHPSGVFGQLESIWSQQSNQGYRRDIPGDDFWQFNVFVGYRFPRRHAELRVGVLNITDQDYRLNPLNLTPELPRDRTLYASLRFHF